MKLLLCAAALLVGSAQAQDPECFATSHYPDGRQVS